MASINTLTTTELQGSPDYQALADHPELQRAIETHATTTKGPTQWLEPDETQQTQVKGTSAPTQWLEPDESKQEQSTTKDSSWLNKVNTWIRDFSEKTGQ